MLEVDSKQSGRSKNFSFFAKASTSPGAARGPPVRVWDDRQGTGKNILIWARYNHILTLTDTNRTCNEVTMATVIR